MKSFFIKLALFAIVGSIAGLVVDAAIQAKPGPVEQNNENGMFQNPIDTLFRIAVRLSPLNQPLNK